MRAVRSSPLRQSRVRADGRCQARVKREACAGVRFAQVSSCRHNAARGAEGEVELDAARAEGVLQRALDVVRQGVPLGKGLRHRCGEREGRAVWGVGWA